MHLRLGLAAIFAVVLRVLGAVLCDGRSRVTVLGSTPGFFVICLEIFAGAPAVGFQPLGRAFARRGCPPAPWGLAAPPLPVHSTGGRTAPTALVRASGGSRAAWLALQKTAGTRDRRTDYIVAYGRAGLPIAVDSGARHFRALLHHVIGAPTKLSRRGGRAPRPGRNALGARRRRRAVSGVEAAPCVRPPVPKFLNSAKFS